MIERGEICYYWQDKLPLYNRFVTKTIHRYIVTNITAFSSFGIITEVDDLKKDITSNKTKNKKYHTVEIVLKSLETVKNDTLNTHAYIYDHKLYWPGICTSIRSGETTIVVWYQTSSLRAKSNTKWAAM